MSGKNDYHKKMEDKMQEWGSKLDDLKAKAQRAEAETKVKINQEINALQQKQEVAQEKLQELDAAGEEAWEDLKVGVEKAWDDIGRAVSSAQAKFK